MSVPLRLTHEERDLVSEAIQELQDLTCLGTSAAAYAGLDETSALDQVEATRAAMSAASKVVTAFRRRVARASS